jgi:hypothetical protein
VFPGADRVAVGSVPGLDEGVAFSRRGAEAQSLEQHVSWGKQLESRTKELLFRISASFPERASDWPCTSTPRGPNTLASFTRENTAPGLEMVCCGKSNVFGIIIGG